jgi:hypothetical protein
MFISNAVCPGSKCLINRNSVLTIADQVVLGGESELGLGCIHTLLHVWIFF